MYDEYKEKLKPNRKSATDVMGYLEYKYPIREITDEDRKQIIVDNVLQNEHDAEKFHDGKKPVVRVYSIKSIAKGKKLYEKQDDIYKGMNIVIGLELETGFFMVEGSSMLWDELFGYRGLDEEDLNNYYLVAEYINCLKRFNMLDITLGRK